MHIESLSPLDSVQVSKESKYYNDCGSLPHNAAQVSKESTANLLGLDAREYESGFFYFSHKFLKLWQEFFIKDQN